MQSFLKFHEKHHVMDSLVCNFAEEELHPRRFLGNFVNFLEQFFTVYVWSAAFKCKNIYTFYFFLLNHIWEKYRKLMATLDSYFRKGPVYLHDKLEQEKIMIEKTASFSMFN